VVATVTKCMLCSLRYVLWLKKWLSLDSGCHSYQVYAVFCEIRAKAEEVVEP
jgi:hypothetical protein